MYNDCDGLKTTTDPADVTSLIKPIFNRGCAVLRPNFGETLTELEADIMNLFSGNDPTSKSFAKADVHIDTDNDDEQRIIEIAERSGLDIPLELAELIFANVLEVNELYNKVCATIGISREGRADLNVVPAGGTPRAPETHVDEFPLIAHVTYALTPLDILKTLPNENIWQAIMGLNVEASSLAREADFIQSHIGDILFMKGQSFGSDNFANRIALPHRTSPEASEYGQISLSIY